MDVETPEGGQSALSTTCTLVNTKNYIDNTEKMSARNVGKNGLIPLLDTSEKVHHSQYTTLTTIDKITTRVTL